MSMVQISLLKLTMHHYPTILANQMFQVGLQDGLNACVNINQACESCIKKARLTSLLTYCHADLIICLSLHYQQLICEPKSARNSVTTLHLPNILLLFLDLQGGVSPHKKCLLRTISSRFVLNMQL